MTKTALPAAADGNLTYAIAVTNSGPDGSANATLNDDLPPGMTLVSFTAPADWMTIAPAAGNGRTVTATTSTLASGATAKFALVVHAEAAAAGGSTIPNTATVSSTTTDPNPKNNRATTAVTTTSPTKAVPESGADLAVTLTGSPDPAVADTDLTYTIVVTNNGPGSANATLTDVLPAGVTVVSSSGPADWEMTTPAVDSGGTVSATTPALGNGATATFIVVVHPGSAARVGETITNTASVASTAVDPKPENNSATATTHVKGAQADLAVTQTASPDPVLPGSDLHVHDRGHDNGPDGAGATLTDTLAPGITFVSFSAPADWHTTNPAVGGGGTVTATHPELASGATATFTLVVHVPTGAPAGSTISNTATVAAAVDPMPDNNSATTATQVKGSLADLAVTMTALPASVPPGNDITYSIVLTNSGPDDAASATLMDTLPPGLTVVSLPTPAGWASVAPAGGNGGTVIATTTTLAKGATATFTLVVRVNPPGRVGSIIFNNVTVNATTPDPNAANNSATATTTVVYAPVKPPR